MMDIIPAEYAWIIPILIPLLIGLLVGVIVKKTIKLVVVIAALIIIMVAVGFIQFPSFEELAGVVTNYMPMLWADAGPLINILPITSATFLIGLALGLWKG